jgi:hypothetical protein
MASRLFAGRYFLRKLKKVKKSNGQMLAINEVQPILSLIVNVAMLYELVWIYR